MNSYRDLLAKTTQLFKLMEEIEEWISQKMQIVYKFNSSNTNTTESVNLNKYVDDVQQFNENNIDKIKQLANEIYGK